MAYKKTAMTVDKKPNTPKIIANMKIKVNKIPKKGKK